MNLSETFASLAHQDTVQLNPTWAQGRALFGGLTGALMLAKLQHFIGEPRRLRSMTVSFVAPIDTAGEISLHPSILRVGKYVLQGEVKMYQNGEVQAVLLASFGEARETTAQQRNRKNRPSLPPAEQIAALQVPPHLVPAFMQHTDIRWAYGSPPFSGAEFADYGGYMRLKNQTGKFELAHLVTLGDAFPPSICALLKQPAPLSSLTWTLELIESLDNPNMEDFWQYDVQTDFAAEGYAHNLAHIWDKHGRLVAISRQTMTAFG